MGRLLKAFNFAYQPRSHACDLVQALHVVLRMLDRLNASGHHCCWLLPLHLCCIEKVYLESIGIACLDFGF